MTRLAPEGEWVSWSQTAVIAGCTVRVVEHHVYSGRIARRTSADRKPTLSRTSVEEFAAWWAERQARLSAPPPAAGRPRAPKPPAPDGWLTTQQAAALLGVTSATIVRMVNDGGLVGVLHLGRWWVDEPSLQLAVEERLAWVSYDGASRETGCPVSTLERAARAGRIERRPGPKRQPSLKRASVLEFTDKWRLEQEAAERARRTRDHETHSPSVGGVWLDTSTTALVLRVSRSRVQQLAAEGRLPVTRRGARSWSLREHVEMVAAAEAFRQRART